MMKTAGWLIFVSAFLHLAAPFVFGFNAETLSFLIFGVLYIVLGLGLTRGFRWVAWISFFIMLIGAVAAFSYSFGGSAVSGWWFTLILGADVLAAICLFMALWSRPEPTQNN